MIPEYDTVAMQLYTEKYEAEELSPTPDITTVPDVTPDVTSAPDATVTEPPITENPDPGKTGTEVSADTDSDTEKESGIHPVTLIMVLVGLAAFVTAFIIIIKKYYKNRK